MSSLNSVLNSLSNQPKPLPTGHNLYPLSGIQPAASLTSTKPKDLAQPLSSTSDKNSFSVNKALGNIATLFSQVTDLSRTITDQVRRDRANGLGVLNGASQFSDAARVARDLIKIYETSRLSSQQPLILTPDISLDNIGAWAQEYLTGRLKDEAITYITEKTGIDLSKMGFKDLADEAFDYITGEISSVFKIPGGSVIDELLPNTNTTTSVTSQIGSTAGRIVSAAGAAYAGYNFIEGWGKGDPVNGAVNGATAGAYIGSAIVPGLGTVVGGVIGGVAGIIGGLVKTGKHPDQKARDQVRSFMLHNGIIDDKWNLQLADGAKFDIGRDGRATLDNLDGTKRKMYETDASNPLTAETIGLANPLAVILTAANPKLTSDFAGYFTNAALSNATSLDDAKRNMLTIFKSFNMSPDQIGEALQSLASQGKISAEQLNAYINGFIGMFQ